MLGHDRRKRRAAASPPVLGYLPQELGYHRHFTVAAPRLRRDTERDHRRPPTACPVGRVLAEVGLADVAGKRIRTLSGGMRRRLGMARRCRPPWLVVFDEPTAGLDPEQRLRFRELLSGFPGDRTVVLSTHQVDDVTAVCSSVVVILGGKARFTGTPAELADLAAGRVWSAQERDAAADLSWRGGDGSWRHIGTAPPGATLVKSTAEDGYLTLTGALDGLAGFTGLAGRRDDRGPRARSGGRRQGRRARVPAGGPAGRAGGGDPAAAEPARAAGRGGERGARRVEQLGHRPEVVGLGRAARQQPARARRDDAARLPSGGRAGQPRRRHGAVRELPHVRDDAGRGASHRAGRPLLLAVVVEGAAVAWLDFLGPVGSPRLGVLAQGLLLVVLAGALGTALAGVLPNPAAAVFAIVLLGVVEWDLLNPFGVQVAVPPATAWFFPWTQPVLSGYLPGPIATIPPAAHLAWLAALTGVAACAGLAGQPADGRFAGSRAGSRSAAAALAACVAAAGWSGWTLGHPPTASVTAGLASAITHPAQTERA